MTITQYIDRKDKLNNTLYIITALGEGYFVESEQHYTREEFSKKYPLPLSLVSHNGDNCDKTKNYLHTD